MCNWFFSKYDCVIPIKDKKGTSIVNAFKKILSDSNRKPNKTWVDQGSEFYNESFKDFLKINSLQWFINFLIKSPLRLINLREVVLLMNQIINWQMNLINQLSENFKKEKFIRHIEITFGVLI